MAERTHPALARKHLRSDTKTMPPSLTLPLSRGRIRMP
jgi:hypothetical protein